MTSPDFDAIERNITGFSHARFEIYADPDGATADIWAVTEDIDDPYVIASDVERHIAESIVARLNFAPVLAARVRELEAEIDHLRSLLGETVDIAAGYVAGRMAPKGVRPNANEQIANDTWRRVMEISGLIFSPGAADRRALGEPERGEDE